MPVGEGLHGNYPIFYFTFSLITKGASVDAPFVSALTRVLSDVCSFIRCPKILNRRLKWFFDMCSSTWGGACSPKMSKNVSMVVWIPPPQILSPGHARWRQLSCFFVKVHFSPWTFWFVIIALNAIIQVLFSCNFILQLKLIIYWSSNSVLILLIESIGLQLGIFLVSKFSLISISSFHANLL